ncbi:MAG TPA: type II secretion system F family protein [Methylophilaceae bacterium]|jgi:tight adherence protein B
MITINYVGVLLIAFSLLVLATALWLLHRSRKARFLEQVDSRFEQILRQQPVIDPLQPSGRPSFWQQLRLRASIYAGFEIRNSHFFTIPALFILIGLAGLMAFGWLGALLSFSLSLFVFGFVLPYRRLRRKQALIVSQIPIFIDQVLRSLSTGRSLESAIRLAAEDTKPPFRYMLDRIMRETDLGADMTDSFTQAAELHGLKELGLIALAMRISNSYGSSPNDMLDRVVQMIRQQELARRELAAMTGETRITAWVLGLTPLLLAAYMLMVNPNYINLMLQDDSGKTILMAALGFQAVGSLLLWRMLKSI